MSKYDNLFKNNNSNTTSYNNSYTSSNNRSKYNSFVSSNKPPEKITYAHKDNEFPDLKPDVKISLKPIMSQNKKYSDITLTVIEKELVAEILVPPGWIQYSRSKVLNKNGLFDVTYGEKIKGQLEQEQRELKSADPLYIHQKMVATLVDNWSRYKMQYDQLHGEEAYDLVYYTDPIYALDNDENELDKVIHDNYNYNYDSQEEYNPRNYSEIVNDIQ